MVRRPTLGPALILLGLPAWGVAEAPQPGPAVLTKPAAAIPLEMRLVDDSIVHFIPGLAAIEVTTRFGKLTIPVEDIRRIEFATRIPEATEKKITEAIARLGDVNFRQREAAVAELLTYKELAYPALKRAQSSSDPEIVNRAADLVRKLEDRLPPEKLRFRDDDLIVTTDFPVKGRIATPAFKVRSPHLGEVSLPLADLRVLSCLTGAKAELPIDAANYATPAGTWLATQVEVAPGMALDIHAAGQVSIYLGNGCTALPHPDGMPPAGGPDQFSVGTLIGRIGPNGKPFMVGSRYSGTPVGEGMLYLRIVDGDWWTRSGNYTVKIATTPTVGSPGAPKVPAGPTGLPAPRPVLDAKK